LYNGSSAAAVIQVNSSGDSTNPGQDSIIKVYIQVVGQNNDILYGPGGITLDKNNQYGLTPIGALNATGLSWQFSERFPGLVVNIGGMANEGMSGWMFKVNGVAPSIPASDYNLLEGDQLIWWYSSDAGSSGPDWDDTLTAPLAVPVLGSKDQEIKKALDLYNGAFDQLTSTTLVINGDKAMSYEQRAALKKDLDGNSVKILAEAGEEEAVLTDDKQEIILLLPKESLNGKINLSVEENASSADVQQYAVKIVSPVYDFGPDGTVFDGPVTIALKVPLNEGVNLNNLTPAYYDDEIRQWVPIPGIVDVEKCLVVFKTTHFTSYALIETPLRKSFSDLDESLSWARDAIEILAGQGVVQGTGKGFEPQRLINRAEFVQLLAKAWQWDDEINPAGVFKDVDSSDWFASAAAAAFQKDIIKGYPDGSFGPLNNITRNEMAIILQKLAGEDNEENNSLTFKDQKDIPDWALKGVKYACRKELIKGYEDETFKGGNPLKRAEAAVIIFRCLNQNQS
ncbi:MAG: S-layer homology domain-containing protein, partial [Syntrophomonas sp.]